MSLLALLAASRASGDTTPPEPPALTRPDSTLFATSAVHIDWSQVTTLVTAAQLPGYGEVREQDDIIYDPGATDPARRFCFYFSAMLGAASHIFVMHSPDGVEWTNPVFCFSGQDPSITQTWTTNPVAYRDPDGKLVLFCENNTTNEIDAWTSTDGLAWVKVKSSAIAKSGAESGLDHNLVGSPIARHDGTRFIVGYEGIQRQPRHLETFSLAWGTTPSTLTKSPHTPIVDPNTISSSNSIVADNICLSPDGTYVILSAHRGYHGGPEPFMWRMYTTNLDPTTWQPGDLTMLDQVDNTRIGDFTFDAYHGLAVTTYGPPVNTSEGNASCVTVPLVAGPLAP